MSVSGAILPRPKRKLLWLDDRIGEFEDLAREAFASQGVELLPASTVEKALEFLEMAESEIPDFWVDIDLKQTETGLDFIERATVVGHCKRIGCRIAIVSSNLKSRQHGPRVKELVRNGRCKKTIPIDAHSFDSVAKFSEKFIPEMSPVEGSTISSPLRISQQEFLVLDRTQRTAASARAIDEALPFLQSSIDEGYRWILFVGNELEILARHRSIAHAWTDREIRERADMLGRPCYQYVITDEPEECGPISPAYPTVSLRFMLDDGSELVERMHFDTGANTSFLALETAEARGLIGEIYNLTPLTKRDNQTGLKVKTGTSGALLEFEVDFVSIPFGDEAPVLLRAWVVEPWLSSVYVRLCAVEKCSVDRASEALVCTYRTGLIGRSLLADNTALRLVLDHTGFTCVASSASNP